MCVCVVRLVALCIKQIHTRKLAYDSRAPFSFTTIFFVIPRESVAQLQMSRLSRFYYYTDICTEKFYETNQFFIKSQINLHHVPLEYRGSSVFNENVAWKLINNVTRTKHFVKYLLLTFEYFMQNMELSHSLGAKRQRDNAKWSEFLRARFTRVQEREKKRQKERFCSSANILELYVPYETHHSIHIGYCII